jgi:hypothetical protein
MTARINSYKNAMTMTPEARCLEPQAVERLPGLRSGDAILCRRGILWVTQEGDPEDSMLRRGEVFIASRQGLVLVQALTQASYRLSRDYKLFDWRRIWPLSFPG